MKDAITSLTPFEKECAFKRMQGEGINIVEYQEIEGIVKGEIKASAGLKEPRRIIRENVVVLNF